MQVVSIISTKAGSADHHGRKPGRSRRGRRTARAVARSRCAAHLVLLRAAQRAPGGIYELLAFNERDLGQLVSHDHRGPGPGALQRPPGELNTLLLHAPDGRLRLRHLLPILNPSTTWC